MKASRKALRPRSGSSGPAKDSDVPYAPYIATTSSPFAGVTVLDSPTGDDFAVDTALAIKGTIGETVFDFCPGPTDYFDVVNTLRVHLYSGELASASPASIHTASLADRPPSRGI